MAAVVTFVSLVGCKGESDNTVVIQEGETRQDVFQAVAVKAVSVVKPFLQRKGHCQYQLPQRQDRSRLRLRVN